MPVQAVSQDVICLQPLPEEAECGQWRDSIAYVNVPSFPGCDIKINVRIRECSYYDDVCDKTRWLVQFYVSGIDWIIPDPPDIFSPCGQLTKHLFPGWPNDFDNVRLDRLQELFKDIQEVLADQIFTNFYNSSSPIVQQTMHCPPPDCQLPEDCSAFTVYYSMPKCVAFCYSECWVNGVRNMFINQMSCTETLVCCEHKREYCYCPATQQVKLVQTITSQIGTCESSVFDPAMCPAVSPNCNWRAATDCTINCEE